MIQEPVVIALNTSTYTAIEIPVANKRCRPISVHTEDSSSFLIAIDDSGTGEAIIPAPGIYSNDCVTDTNGVIFYAKASAGTPNLVVLIGVN